jgi:hypothetical protein
MRAEELLLLHIQNLHEQLELPWYADTAADVAAIVNLIKAEVKREILEEMKDTRIMIGYE